MSLFSRNPIYCPRYPEETCLGLVSACISVDFDTYLTRHADGVHHLSLKRRELSLFEKLYASENAV
jgi:hypothetical protein